METNVNYTAVGLFVILIFSGIIFGVIWLSSGLQMESNKTYKVYMKESVSGLNVDAPVEFNGVNVGTVKSITIDQQDIQSVELLLSVKGSAPITQGTRAMMNTRGLTGVAFIALQDKGTDKALLPILSHEQYPVIATAPSLFLRIDTALSKFNESVHQISVSVQALLNQDNLRAIKDTLENLREVTAMLTPLVHSSSEVISIFSTKTLPAANQTMQGLDDVIHNLNSITREIKQNPSVIIRGKQSQILGPGEK